MDFAIQEGAHKIVGIAKLLEYKYEPEISAVAESQGTYTP
jgi:hypothetical protein